MRPEGEVRLDRRRDARGIERVRVRLQPFGWSVHVSDAFSAIAVVSGEGTLHCRGEELVLAPRAVRVTTPLELFVLRTQESALEVSLAHVPAALVPRRRGEPSRRAAELADWLVRYAEPDPGPDELASDQLVQLLADAGAAARGRVRPGGLEPGPVRRARHHLETRYDTLPTLDDLAAEVGTSKFHLVRMFRAYHGVPPHTYLIYYRIALARKMIAAGERGADTAHATGFADQSHFSRSFRRVVGMSPIEYARLSPVARDASTSGIRRGHSDVFDAVVPGESER